MSRGRDEHSGTVLLPFNIFFGPEQLCVLVCNAKICADFDNEPPAFR